MRPDLGVEHNLWAAFPFVVFRVEDIKPKFLWEFIVHESLVPAQVEVNLFGCARITFINFAIHPLVNLNALAVIKQR